MSASSLDTQPTIIGNDQGDRVVVMPPLPIDISKDQIADFCQRHHIRRLSLFGSILRDDFTPNSDVDFLVEFEPDNIPGYLGLAGMEIELSKLIGRKADLRTAQELSPYFREDVLQEAVLPYDQN